ncbi:hypothetical protein TREMEDRAFT_36411 [Tremella mesenterica DSM 1558]|uniref:uncharacterized protein n=1 Tax=Tremella mesenterica (strain ATCC 24925 / CBS 8224 / DSM 1558 / NBRC 9311 / NRRL Y-6157 / RJB 2259-6 / UBC 559-6) TaxID=578456 RepID=UPI0003F49FD5|nr:uncharacterized protein TREMEDRAFT_36411 [Tremella mesenterica DSM 1558]EIW72078.1 hypothetical protein TREMEDRAFT_36411 [Tremella mesenterica DSM 1558]
MLVFTATAGYRHDSIDTAKQVLGEQGGNYNVSFSFSEDASLFTDDGLRVYDGIMFALNSDEILNTDQQAALARWIQSGGVIVAVHSGCACLYNDSAFNQSVGALFDYHPMIQSATFTRLNTTHPATSSLPDRWTYDEEVYYFRSDPRSNGAVVLLSVDESSYNDDGSSSGSYPSQGEPHPIAWYIESPLSAQPLLLGAVKAGRSFTTSLGHLNSTWQNQTFIDHLMGGVTWALEGASTLAYGVGIIGNGSESSSLASPTSSSPSSTSNSIGSSSKVASSTSNSAPSSSGSTTSWGEQTYILNRQSLGLTLVVGVLIGIWTFL